MSIVTHTSVAALGTADEMPIVKSWADFGALFASRIDAHNVERVWLVRAARDMGLDLDADPSSIAKDIRDGICDGIRAHYVATTPSRKYRRGEDRALMLVTDGTTFDIEVSSATAMVPAESLTWMKKSDRALYNELRALKTLIDTRTRVRYASLFEVNKTAKREAARAAAGAASVEEREAAKGAGKAAKGKAEPKPMTLETIAGMCEAMFTGLEAAQKAGTLPKAKVAEVAAAVATLRKATGIAAK